MGKDRRYQDLLIHVQLIFHDFSIDDLRHGRVRATKLVYRIADTPELA